MSYILKSTSTVSKALMLKILEHKIKALYMLKKAFLGLFWWTRLRDLNEGEGERPKTYRNSEHIFPLKGSEGKGGVGYHVKTADPS